MSIKNKEIFVLSETEEKERKKSGKMWEQILILLILAGILLFLRDFSYSAACLFTAFCTGAVIVFLYWITENSERAAGRLKTVLYLAWIAVFLVTITMTVQGFLYLADCFLGMWNSRFGTEAVLFAVGSSAGMGSVILWALFAVAAVSFMSAQLKKGNIYNILALMIPAAACGLILGQSNMWMAVFLSLAGFFGIFIVNSTKGRDFGVRGAVAILIVAALVGSICMATGGYEKSAGIEQWKERFAADLEKIRYGEDSLPKGDLRKEAQLLDGEKETLKISINQPQELYLRGFVGGSYQGTRWAELPYSAYEGEYEGMLDWLKQNGFSPLNQFALYDSLNAEASGQSESYVRATVENTGAYRKYVYLPEVAKAGNTGVACKDWNTRSRSFFGARKYEFQVAQGDATADGMSPGNWLGAPYGEEQEKYVNAESVYHSFVLDSYTEVADDLKGKIQEEFFSGDKAPEEMSFDELTTQIRQVLRNHIRYTEIPGEVPGNEDLVNWLLDGRKEGNAVAFASAAVMAYRVAGYPARYTEGYHLSDLDAKAAADAGEKEVILTTKNAHAWAEVYISGLGWMPVEVVPGLYTETYTDNLVEGKPSYRVNGVQNDSGTDTTDQGTAGASGKEERKNVKKQIWKSVPGVIVLSLYAVFVLYLLLEAQRAIRLEIRRKKKEGSAARGELVEWYVAEMEKLFLMGRIKGDLTDPSALYDEIKSCFPGIRREEYERSCALIQKYRFGGMELQPQELRVLEGMEEKFRQCLYKKQKAFGKLKLRYIYAR